MNTHQKVQSQHLERLAYLYIRQSSPKQIIDNAESGKRQYALQSRAEALGWKKDQITVIDSDQGESGASASWREGFQYLVTEVGMGRVGIVMGLEVSRLARNNADWHRLLEICGLTETLILDEDGVYDPKNFNDRLLLGMKGTMSEAELHVLHARLQGGILNKAARGEFRCPLPTGFIYDELGNVVLDPDEQVRKTIHYFFETFQRVGSACQTVKVFQSEGVQFPSRLRNSSDVVFRPLTPSSAQRTLRNPRYAGTYAYGIRRYRRTTQGKEIKRKSDMNDWTACIPGAHPGYISWEQYQTNVKILAANGRGYELARKSPPREGSALLQGRAVCAKCGGYLRVRYRNCRGRNESWYVCDSSARHGSTYCQSIAGPPVDEAIGRLVIEEMTPAAIDKALDVRKEIESRQNEVEKIRRQAIERAEYEAELAQRRYMMVDPNNRLVAASLEAEWNEKLRAVETTRKEYEQYKKAYKSVDQTTISRLNSLILDFDKIWHDPSIPNRERKRLLSHIVEDVTLKKSSEDGVITIHARFKGGKTKTLTALTPKLSCEQIQTPTKIIQLVDQLLDDHIYSEISDILNDRGIQPGFSTRKGRETDRFTTLKVRYLANAYRIRPRQDRLRDRGFLTCNEIAEKLGVHVATVRSWIKSGKVKRHAYDGHSWLYEHPDLTRRNSQHITTNEGDVV